MQSVAKPDPNILTAPAPPEILPVANQDAPPTPVVPALADRTVTLPLLVAVPSPEPNIKAPPVFTVLRPANACTLAPAPLVPLPTVSMTAPGAVRR